MFRFALTLLISLWTLTSFSQEEVYPKKILISTDTFVVYQPWQVKYINEHYVLGLTECKETNDSLYSAVAAVLTTLNDKDNVISSQGTDLFYKQATIDSKDIQLDLNDKEISKLNRQKTFFKIGGTVVLGVAIGEAIYILLNK